MHFIVVKLQRIEEFKLFMTDFAAVVWASSKMCIHLMRMSVPLRSEPFLTLLKVANESPDTEMHSDMTLKVALQQTVFD